MTAPTNKEAILTAQLQQMRSAFHVNMLRAFPKKTHAEIAEEIEKACGPLPAHLPAQAVAEVRLSSPNESGERFAMVNTLGDFDLEHLPDGTKFYLHPPTVAASPSVQGESIDSERFRELLKRVCSASACGMPDVFEIEVSELVAHIGYWHRARLARTAAPSDLEDPILIPRGLIGAACYLIRQHDPECTLLTKLRAFTFDRHEEVAAAAPSEGLAIPIAESPAEYQYRTRPTWRADGEGWSEWMKCSAGSYEDYRKAPKLHDWQYQTRELFLRTPATEQAKPELAGLTDGPAKFTKKPVTISAIRWTGANLREVICFTDGPPDVRHDHAAMKWEEYGDLVARDGLKIFTLEGKMSADIGDWIIKGVKGEHYPCKPDVFAMTYGPATQPVPQASGERPAPCARSCEANAFRIEIRRLEAAQASGERDAWVSVDERLPKAIEADDGSYPCSPGDSVICAIWQGAWLQAWAKQRYCSDGQWRQGDLIGFIPTHWQPLPAAPSSAATASKPEGAGQ